MLLYISYIRQQSIIDLFITIKREHEITSAYCINQFFIVALAKSFSPYSLVIKYCLKNTYIHYTRQYSWYRILIELFITIKICLQPSKGKRSTRHLPCSHIIKLQPYNKNTAICIYKNPFGEIQIPIETCGTY